MSYSGTLNLKLSFFQESGDGVDGPLALVVVALMSPLPIEVLQPVHRSACRLSTPRSNSASVPVEKIVEHRVVEAFDIAVGPGDSTLVLRCSISFSAK